MIDIANKDILELKYDKDFEKQHFMVHFRKRMIINAILFILLVVFTILEKTIHFNFGTTGWRIVGYVIFALILFFFYNLVYTLFVPASFNFSKPVYVIDDKALLYGSYSEFSSIESGTLLAMELRFNKIDNVTMTQTFIIVNGDITRKVYNKEVNDGNNDNPWEEINEEKLKVVKIPRKFKNEDKLIKYLKQ